MRLALKAHFRFIIVLALCLATPLAVLADFNVEPPCPMMADGSMPGASAEAHPCKMPCAQDPAAADACSSCQFCNAGGAYRHSASLQVRGAPPSYHVPRSAFVSLIEHAPAPLWRPPRTV